MHPSQEGPLLGNLARRQDFHPGDPERLTNELVHIRPSTRFPRSARKVSRELEAQRQVVEEMPCVRSGDLGERDRVRAEYETFAQGVDREHCFALGSVGGQVR